jgi:cobalt-precorrin 5A hydrolase/precorrin-3B C17-methyltransferase
VPDLIVGLGAVSGISETAVRAAFADLVTEIDFSHVVAFASVSAKAAEPGIVAALDGVPFFTYPPEELAKIAVPNPSEVTFSYAGTASVAEAAAIHCARQRGRAELVVGKRVTGHVTVAVVRLAR